MSIALLIISFFITDSMPKNWPTEAVEALNHHFNVVGGKNSAYKEMLRQYTGTLGMCVPWSKNTAEADNVSEVNK